jgi:hypothetical protein
MVTIGVLGFLPWMWVVASLIRVSDEFSRRIHADALSLAFALTGVFVVAADFLQRARFVDVVPLTAVWIVMVVAWWLSIIFMTRYYR